MSDSSLSLARLRRTLARLEPHRAAAPAGLFASGHPEVDAALGGGLARGRLHEVFADADDAGAGAATAALLCLRAAIGADHAAGPEPGTPARPWLWLRAEAAGKRSGGISGAGLGELGCDPAGALFAVAPDEPALLHAAAEAARCAGLGALLVECWGAMRGLDLTASRRLMLAAETSGVTVLLLRLAATPRPGAADTRWRAAAAPSVALEASAPGAAAFEWELLRRRAGPPAGPWRVEWDRDRLSFQAPQTDVGSQSSLPRPVLPVAAGGLRRAG